MFNAPLNHPVGLGNPQASLPVVAVGRDLPALIDLGTVQIHCGLFEVPYAQVMAVLPPSLHPSTPAYASLTFYRIPESPVGAFELAVLGVACRNTIKPRMLTLSAFASNAHAATFCREQWGYPCEVADVRTRQPYHGAVSEIMLDGRCVARMRSEDAEILLGAARAVRYPQALNLADADGSTGMLQVDMVYNYTDSYRGRLVLESFDSAIMTGDRVHPSDLIAATLVTAGLQIKPRRILLGLDQVGDFTKLASAAPQPVTA